MKDRLVAYLFRLQLHAALRRLLRHRAIVLMYHGFTNKSTHDGIANYHGKHVHVVAFRKQLEYLKRHHYVISLRTLVDCLTERKPIPKGAVVITFDDGYKSNYTVAYSILRELGLHATIFVASGFVGNADYLWTDRVEHALNSAPAGVFNFKMNGEPILIDLRTRTSRIKSHQVINRLLKKVPDYEICAVVDEIETILGAKIEAGAETPEMYQPLDWVDIKQMIEGGLVEVGSHTHRHSILTRCSTEEARNEMRESRRMIEEATETKINLFAYPNGGPGDFNAQTGQLLKEEGYSCAATTVRGFNGPATDVYGLRRIAISDTANFGMFLMTLYGVVDALAAMKTSVAKALWLRR